MRHYTPLLMAQPTLKVANADGRKVYAHNGNLEPHFAKLPPNAPRLEQIGSDDHEAKGRFSFANLMHLHRPLVSVDEAPNNSSGVSFEVVDVSTPHVSLNSQLHQPITAKSFTVFQRQS